MASNVSPDSPEIVALATRMYNAARAGDGTSLSPSTRVRPVLKEDKTTHFGRDSSESSLVSLQEKTRKIKLCNKIVVLKAQELLLS